jgi:PIN domain nuclease of toxin-antitoxin system
LDEPGYGRVAAALPRSCISAVNLAEVLARLQRDGGDLHEYLADLGQTGLEVVQFDQQQALLTAQLLPKTRPYGLSLGDRACLALAWSRGVPALTADRSWSRIELGIQIELIR